MASNVINTRADLDAIAGTPEHAAFMAMLTGTLWRLEKDEAAKTWVAIEDNTTIARFGFSRADFPGVQAPALPVYVSPDLSAEKEAALSEFRVMRDTAVARLNGLIVDELLEAAPDQAVMLACRAAIAGLKAIPQHQTVIDAVGRAETNAAMQTIYRGLAVQLATDAPSAYTAFRGFDL